MTESFHRRSGCRLCGSKYLTLVLKIKATPPANAFVSKENLSKNQEKFPLDVYFCENCNHIQLLDILDPKILFEEYVYVSGTSQTFIKHFEDYANYVIDNYHFPSDSLVIDIGSNDGTLLQFFKKHGLRTLGIDPAKEIAKQANLKGIETLNAFFNFKFSNQILSKYGKAAIVTANNVFAHIDNLDDFIKAVKNILLPHGIFVFEVSYLVDVLEKTLFDTIYHEHLSYHSVTPVIKFFRKNGMELVEARRIASHGGSLRGIAVLSNAYSSVDKSVDNCIKIENIMQLNKADTFIDFDKKINKKGTALNNLLKKLKNDGKTISGFGAPAKATTLMYHFGIDDTIIDFIVDDNPLKQGLFTPGMHIPVLSSDALYEKKPDFLLILAWNFAESIMKNHEKYKKLGGSFIIPLPELHIY